jgi:cobalt-zinc-cadmium efflux system protein
MHVWSLDGTRNMATLHACLAEGTDPEGAVRAIKQRLARRHGIGHATVESEFGRCSEAPQAK